MIYSREDYDKAHKRLKLFLSKIEYKSNVYFEVRDKELITLTALGHNSVYWSIRCLVTDSTKKHGPLIEVIHAQVLHTDYLLNFSDDDLIEEIRDAFVKMEYHELDEFFKYDGKQLHNPHANEKA